MLLKTLFTAGHRIARRWQRVARFRVYPPGVRRSSRAITLLTVLAVLNAFDFAFTHAQLPRGNFAEANLLAAGVVTAPLAMATFKVGLFGLGAGILYHLRKRWQSEAGLWLLVACYTGLMVWWVAYIGTVEKCLSDPAVRAPWVAF